MALSLGEIKLRVTVNDNDDTPHSAYVEYVVQDGAAARRGFRTIDPAEFAKVIHNTGAVGEFWADMVADIKTAEGIS